VNIHLGEDLLELGEIERSADQMKAIFGRDDAHGVILSGLLNQLLSLENNAVDVGVVVFVAGPVAI